jgi:hypothetical protein
MKLAQRRISHAYLLAPKGGSQFNLMIVDQAAINAAGFDFRRYAMKPMPAKPSSIIAHVGGSGTAGAR